MYIHRRQFVIGPRPFTPVSGWVTTHIPNIGYLSHCPELRVATAQDANGKVWYLLGLAVQTDANTLVPLDQLATATRTTVDNIYQSWAGRWILIGDGKLYMDAGGLLGCFYSLKEPVGKARELWVSSSAALLAHVLNVDVKPVRSIYHAVGIDWYTPPRSGLTSIRRLLPSQILVLTSGELLSRRLFPQLPESLSYDQVLDKLQNYLVTALRQAAQLANTVWLPLTAGYDSRLLLATVHYAGIPAKTYTHAHNYIPYADLIISPKLAEAVGLSHSLYWGGPFRKDLAALYDEHTARHCVDRDRYYISREYFNWCQKGDMILKGGSFEIGRCGQWGRFPGAAFDATLPSAEVILKGYKQGSNPSLIHALEEWIAWTTHTPHTEMDWRDRLHLEQKIAGWLSSVEQSLDLIDADRFYAANSQFYFSHVLQVAQDQRCRSQHHVDLIKRMAPELLQFPFNPSGAIHNRVYRKIMRGTEYMRSRLGL